jgi:hypothetical protein
MAIKLSPFWNSQTFFNSQKQTTKKVGNVLLSPFPSSQTKPTQQNTNEEKVKSLLTNMTKSGQITTPKGTIKIAPVEKAPKGIDQALYDKLIEKGMSRKEIEKEYKSTSALGFLKKAIQKINPLVATAKLGVGILKTAESESKKFTESIKRYGELSKKKLLLKQPLSENEKNEYSNLVYNLGLQGEMTAGIKFVGKQAGQVAGKMIAKEIAPVAPKTAEIGALSDGVVKDTINLERLNIPQEAKQTIQKTIQDIKPELETLRGGILKNEEVIEAAKASEILTKITSMEET